MEFKVWNALAFSSWAAEARMPIAIVQTHTQMLIEHIIEIQYSHQVLLIDENNTVATY